MYTVYKITNKINEKTYIGVHKTNDPYDSYMGSGVAIRNAIKKHGINNFVKDILFITEDKDEAYCKEAELTEDFNSNCNYNMKRGGVGGFTIENARKGHSARSRKGGLKVLELKIGIFSTEKLSENGRKGGQKNKGKTLSEEHKLKIKMSILAKRTGSLAAKAGTS